MTRDGPERPVKTVENAFDIVTTLRQQGEMSVTDLATELGMAKSTVHRHLETLVDGGWVARTEHSYRVGLRFLDVGIATRNADPVYQYTRDRIDELSEQTGEKVWCVVEQNGQGVHLYGALGKNSVQTYARVGQRTYLHQHAAGKAILAHRPREEVEAIVERHGLPPITDETITDPAVLFEELERIRERGYSTNLEESVAGLHAVGTAITDQDGYALGSISVSGPATRLTVDVLETQIAETLLEVVNEIEINMEYAGQSDDYTLE